MARFGELDAEAIAAQKVRLRVPGRIRAIREQGKLAFLDLHDGEAKLQLFVRRQALDPASIELLADLDLGDYLLAEGELLRTRAGELSLAPERLDPARQGAAAAAGEVARARRHRDRATASATST